MPHKESINERKELKLLEEYAILPFNGEVSKQCTYGTNLAAEHDNEKLNPLFAQKTFLLLTLQFSLNQMQTCSKPQFILQYHTFPGSANKTL